MIPVVTVIIILFLSVIITKVATIALMHTGLSRQSAKFQARSAFTGVGYATQESENVVNHPLRRRIIMTLMLLSNAGIVSVIATLLLTLLDDQDPHHLSLATRLALLLGGVILLTLFFNSRIVNRGLSRLIHYGLQKYTKLQIADYSGLLHLSGEYEISEVFVKENDWLSQKTLAQLALPKEGLFILGINRKNGTYLGIPDPDSVICPGDTLIIYGRSSAIKRINLRKEGSTGNFERKLSEKENRKIKEEEQKKDQTTTRKKDTPS